MEGISASGSGPHGTETVSTRSYSPCRSRTVGGDIEMIIPNAKPTGGDISLFFFAAAETTKPIGVGDRESRRRPRADQAPIPPTQPQPPAQARCLVSSQTIAGHADERISPTETEAEAPGHGRSKRFRPFDEGSAREGSCPYPAWVVLNRIWLQVYASSNTYACKLTDGTTSAVSHTSRGEQVSVSFELAAEPPRTSLVTLDWPRGPGPPEGTTSYPQVVAAHGNAVLLEIISTDKHPRAGAIDYFVYEAKAGGGKPSLTRLPICYWQGTSNRGRLRPRIMSNEATGMLSCSEDFFIVAELEGSHQPSAATIYSLSSRSDGWSLQRCAHPPWRWRRSLLGLVEKKKKKISRSPFYGKPYETDRAEACPQSSRSLCDTRHGVKFVDVRRHGSSSITTLWSWREDQTWREDAALDAAQLRGLCSENRLPTNAQPEFPVVDMESPCVVCFLLREEGHRIAEPDATTWMVKVDMKRKIVLGCARYSEERRPARWVVFVSSEMPSYLSRQQTLKRKC
uniref:DUF1618 domain-containing protein n=1 Tax=Oryza brachyantha TaxID=4533 RepID=J3KWW5_ORYBR